MNIHIKINHLKIKDKKCPKCTFTCSTSSNLTKHIKTCTGKEHMSSGEFKVKKALESLNIPFEREVSEIKTEKSRLRFDFKITVDNCTKYIEFDGKQHFKPVCFGSMSPEKAQQNFEKIKLHDKLKNEWCKEHGYNLLRINYKDVNNVESLIKEFTTCSIN